MRILYVLEHYHPYIGGSEKLFTDLSTQMAAAGNDVLVVTTKYSSELPSVDEYKGVRILRIRCFNRFLFTFFALFKLLGLRERFDLIHATTYNAAVPAWVYSKIKSIPSVLTFHEVWGKLWFKLPFLHFHQRLGYYLYEQLVIRLTYDTYIAVSNATRQALIKAGIERNKITRIYNGLDYGELEALKTAPGSNEKFEFLFFGRLGVSKGLDLLIPAFSHFHDRVGNTRLTLVLPTQPRSILSKVQKLIRKHHSQEAIKVIHELPYPELIQLISQVDAVVVPSYTEGFCYVAAEACGIGASVIHSNRMSLSEVVSGPNIKMKALNIASLSDALTDAFNGNWEYTPLNKFEIKSTIDEYLKLYSKIS